MTTDQPNYTAETSDQPLDLEDDSAIQAPDPAKVEEEAGGDSFEKMGEEAEKVTKNLPPLPDASSGGAPPWVKIPEGFKFPKGRQVVFLRFKAEWTDTPWKGDRQAIAWPITANDKKMALQRAMGDANRAADELAKQMLRSLDGYKIDWTGSPTPGSIDVWWNEVGERVRTLIIKIFMQMHVLKKEEMIDFFEHCVAVRSTG